MWLNITLRLQQKSFYCSKNRFVYCSIGTEDVRNTGHCCHVVSLANRETVVSHQRSCSRSGETAPAEWAGCSRNALAVLWCHTWQWQSDKFSNRHALLQISCRSVFMALHEVENTYSDRALRTAWFEKEDFKTGILKKTLGGFLTFKLFNRSSIWLLGPCWSTLSFSYHWTHFLHTTWQCWEGYFGNGLQITSYPI